ncbi:aminoglycoside 6-adenylyltransferase [Pedobacter aquatilis]|uniref:aminoglycoside 6-adenylyltransferase n=1 Tax=Pedobacter aquatilis TaxID=351343 RepID=UPI00292E581D|nr:aminoglycoside 6-adenylyltransferase [Pedobacter aquatilis]
MVQHEFAEKITRILKADDNVIGLAAAGSWITNELDEFSDLDLVLVTKDVVGNSKEKMLTYANQFGNLLSAFTGEHVGESRLLICLYDNPLLHVDIKFIILKEFEYRVENPVILLDTNHQLQDVINKTEAKFPTPDFQWIENRFWTWVHYALLKIGRGEYFESLDFFGFLRMIVIGPLLHLRNHNLPRGVRKVETQLSKTDFDLLQSTLSSNKKADLLNALTNIISLYQGLRTDLYPADISLNKAENTVLLYFDKIKNS